MGKNVLFTGATGCGKYHLVCALGHKTCVKEYQTLYYNMNRFTEQIALAKVDGSQREQSAKTIKFFILDNVIKHAILSGDQYPGCRGSVTPEYTQVICILTIGAYNITA